MSLASCGAFGKTFRAQSTYLLNMKRIALHLTLIAAFTGCISTKETVYRETERLKVEFENDSAARIFYEAFTKSPASPSSTTKIGRASCRERV